MSNIMQVGALLVEHDPSEAIVVKAAFDNVFSQGHIHTVGSSIEAISYLHRVGEYKNSVLPDIIFFGVNVSLIDAMQILEKKNANIKVMDRPVVAISRLTNIRAGITRQKLSIHGVIARDRLVKDFHEVMELVVEYWFKGYVDMLISD